MGIDLSKAPEGADYAALDANGKIVCWLADVALKGRSVVRINQWTGEGKPPAGTVCQYQHVHHGGAWYDGEILYISDEYTIVKGHLVGEQHYYTRCLKFLPIRTPEQIAEEAKQKAVDVIEKRIMDRMGDLNTRDLAEDLFDLLGEISKPTDQ